MQLWNTHFINVVIPADKNLAICISQARILWKEKKWIYAEVHDQVLGCFICLLLTKSQLHAYYQNIWNLFENSLLMILFSLQVFLKPTRFVLSKSGIVEPIVPPKIQEVSQLI